MEVYQHFGSELPCSRKGTDPNRCAFHVPHVARCAVSDSRHS